MNQRVLLATVISLSILFSYNIFFRSHAPRMAPSADSKTGLNTSQIVENKEVTENKESTLPPILNQQESIKTLENGKIKLEFTNQGGFIKSITLKDHNHQIAIKDLINLNHDEEKTFFSESQSQDSITYTWQDKNVKISKKYTLDNEYGLNLGVSVNNVEMSNLKKYSFTIDGHIAEKSQNFSSERALYEYSMATESEVIRKNDAVSFSTKESADKSGPVKWIGFRDRYFCLIVKPEFPGNGYNITFLDNKRLSIGLKLSENQDRTFYSNFKVYIGPQDTDVIKQYDPDMAGIVVFSRFGLLDGISKGILGFTKFLHKIIPNWGVCIILISIFIYMALYPLTLKGMNSMKKMQQLQPKITQLKEQHKNNPKKLNTEVMELYKKNGVNPLGGCLPMFLQMPVFFGLYQVLWRSIYFKGAGFLWIKDLSAPDRLIVFKTSLPIIGNELNILPIIMAIVMFFQQKLTSKSMVAADPAQAAQQKFMATFFPIFLGFIFYHFSSGPALYFTVFYFLSTFTQWKMSKVVTTNG